MNKELLQDTLNLIKARPETHNQSNWVIANPASPCGTTMCFAGHAAVLAGAETPDPKKHVISDWYVGKDGQYVNYGEACGLGYHETKGVALFAQNALGLSSEYADYLFHASISRERLEEAVEELITTGSLSAVDNYDEYDDYYDGDDGCDCEECC